MRDGTVVQLGKGILIKTAPVGSYSAPRFGQQEVVTVQVRQNSGA